MLGLKVTLLIIFIGVASFVTLASAEASENLHFLAASQTKDKSSLTSQKVKALIDELKAEYDYVLLDAPAGIESGFENTNSYLLKFDDYSIKRIY